MNREFGSIAGNSHDAAPRRTSATDFGAGIASGTRNISVTARIPEDYGMLWLTIRRLKSHDHHEVIRAAAKLAQSRNRRAVEALAGLVSHHMEEVRTIAGFALAARGDARSLPVLVEYSRIPPNCGIRETDEKRSAAIELLLLFASQGNREAVAACNGAMSASRFVELKVFVRRASEMPAPSRQDTIAAIAEFTDLAPKTGARSEAIGDLCYPLDSPDPQVRQMAARCLAKLYNPLMNPVDALRAQLKLVHDRERTVFGPVRIARALGELDASAAAEVLVAHTPVSREEHYGWYGALAMTPDSRCVKALLTELKEGGVYNMECYRSIETAVRTHANILEEGLLKQIADLGAITFYEAFASGPGVDRPMDCRRLKDAASRELRRRAERTVKGT